VRKGLVEGGQAIARQLQNILLFLLSEGGDLKPCFPSLSSSLLVSARTLAGNQLANFRYMLPIEKRIVPEVCQLVHEVNGHRICLGNWSYDQLRALDSILLP